MYDQKIVIFTDIFLTNQVIKDNTRWLACFYFLFHGIFSYPSNSRKFEKDKVWNTYSKHRLDNKYLKTTKISNFGILSWILMHYFNYLMNLWDKHHVNNNKWMLYLSGGNKWVEVVLLLFRVSHLEFGHVFTVLFLIK